MHKSFPQNGEYKDKETFDFDIGMTLKTSYNR